MNPNPSPNLRQHVQQRLRHLNAWHTAHDIAHSVILNIPGYSGVALNRFFINPVAEELHRLVDEGLAVRMPNPGGDGNVFHWADPVRVRQRALLEAVAALFGDTPAGRDLLAIRDQLR